tara:strand:- start:254 stop:931 length:678 start_codon:yes stop_codon:yes gene_type:complete
MKIKIKKRINEEATGFKSIDELKEYRIKIKSENGQYVFYFFKGDEETAYFILDPEYASCGYFQTHSSIYEDEGGEGNNKYGPFGYDLLIELGTLMGKHVAPSGAPSGWMGDIEEGISAINVWRYYNEKRSDVTKTQITDCPEDKRRARSLLELKNNGYYVRRNPPGMNKAHYEALTKMYQKKPIFLKKLKQAGMISGPEEVMSMIPGEEKKGFYDKMKDYFSKFF